MHIGEPVASGSPDCPDYLGEFSQGQLCGLSEATAPSKWAWPLLDLMASFNAGFVAHRPVVV